MKIALVREPTPIDWQEEIESPPPLAKDGDADAVVTH
jgi:hypothetical protein